MTFRRRGGDEIYLWHQGKQLHLQATLFILIYRRLRRTLLKLDAEIVKEETKEKEDRQATSIGPRGGTGILFLFLFADATGKVN